jgi:hypothetical protein
VRYIQLKDGVAFAYVESPFYIENSIALDSDLEWDDVKAKKYQNGQWVEAPLIYFVTQLKDNVVHQTNSTVFSSDVTGDIVSAECSFGWIKNEDGSYSPPLAPTPVLMPQPYPSWVLNNNFIWQPPVPRPEEGLWYWNEDTQSWDEIVEN